VTDKNEPKSKNASAIMEIVGRSLGIAVTLLELAGDVITAKKVQAILDDADFPAFARRAAAAGESARDELDHG
jgi:hypothetical protein